MSSKKKLDKEDEIDLVEVFSLIWKNKLKFFIITFLPIVIMFFYLQSLGDTKLIFKTRTEIRPISSLNESDYKDLNSFINSNNIQVKLIEEIDKLEPIETFISKDYFTFTQIGRKYLLNLFVEKLNEEEFLVNAIRNFNFLKKENFASTQEYENAILKSAYSVMLTQDASSNFGKWYINFETPNKEKYESFLKYLEESANLEIKNYLIENFHKSVEGQKILQNYKIEDINLRLLNEQESLFVKQLQRYKQSIEDNKFLERVKVKFNQTPIMKSNTFYASKIIINSTTYKNISKKNNTGFKVLFTALLSAIFAIFYILISSKFRR